MFFRCNPEKKLKSWGWRFHVALLCLNLSSKSLLPQEIDVANSLKSVGCAADKSRVVKSLAYACACLNISKVFLDSVWKPESDTALNFQNENQTTVLILQTRNCLGNWFCKLHTKKTVQNRCYRCSELCFRNDSIEFAPFRKWVDRFLSELWVSPSIYTKKTRRKASVYKISGNGTSYFRK